MALWGNKDTVYSTGNITTITITNGNGVITGSGTTFTDSGLVEAGQVITIGTKGGGVIKSVDSNTQLTLVGDTGLTAEGSLTESFNISEQPKYTFEDSNWDADEIYGVDNTEIGVANTATGDARKYAPAHAGWVGVTTYMSDGRLRVKTEVLVAGGISGDASDDTQYPDTAS